MRASDVARIGSARIERSLRSRTPSARKSYPSAQRSWPRGAILSHWQCARSHLIPGVASGCRYGRKLDQHVDVVLNDAELDTLVLCGKR